MDSINKSVPAADYGRQDPGQGGGESAYSAKQAGHPASLPGYADEVRGLAEEMAGAWYEYIEAKSVADKALQKYNRLFDEVSAAKLRELRLRQIDGVETLAERHQRHYQSCNCLGDKAICCDPTCPCHAAQRDGRDDAQAGA